MTTVVRSKLCWELFFTKCEAFYKFVINSIKGIPRACDLNSNSPVGSFDNHMHQNQTTDGQLQR